jgi:hypothetical protein
MTTAEEVLRVRREAERSTPTVTAGAESSRDATAEAIPVLAAAIKREMPDTAAHLAAAVPDPYPGGQLLCRWLGASGSHSTEVAVWCVHTHESGEWDTYSFYFAPTLALILIDHTRKARQDADQQTQQRADPVYSSAVRRNLLVTIDLELQSLDDLRGILGGLHRLEG